ncbi:MAG: RNA-binding S4 domain-containing protein [Solobacterium sp.]|nr:RNA-binding S4 domain-containing protein [Solobacterium sp.]
MRIDKYLKVSRILKRRAVSKELALNRRIEINGKTVKPSHEVNAGDIISVTYGTRKITVRVLTVQEAKRKKDAADMYELISEERISEPVLKEEAQNDIKREEGEPE